MSRDPHLIVLTLGVIIERLKGFLSRLVNKMVQPQPFEIPINTYSKREGEVTHLFWP